MMRVVSNKLDPSKDLLRLSVARGRRLGKPYVVLEFVVPWDRPVASVNKGKEKP